jgi:sterol 14-demethylase
MQTLAEARYPDGSPVPEDTIVGMVLQMVFGAYETTAAQTCWSLIQLLQHPDYLALVLEEQESVLGDRADDIGVDTLRQLKRLEWALKETERMRPMTTMLWRRTTKPYELGGYHIPGGWITIISPAVSHLLPEVFPNPGVYDPERFSPERAEDRKTPFSMACFGGGSHKCPGMSFAHNLMKVIFSLLFRSYTLELANPDPRPDYSTTITKPESPCLVRYWRRS